MNVRSTRLTPLRAWAIVALLLLFIVLVWTWGSALRPSPAAPNSKLFTMASGPAYDGGSLAAPREPETGAELDDD